MAPTPSPTVTPTLIVLGRDEAGKAHASWFDASEAKLASKAAALMGMRALTIATDELRAVSGRLPHGRVFASGRAFVPFVKGALYDELAGHLPPQASPVAARPSSAASAGGSDQPSTPDAGSNHAPSPAWSDVPGDWSKIGAGSLVLAPEANEGDGWFEAIVVEDRGSDLFVLKWRDWPDEPAVARYRWHLGLLHPEHDQHGAW